MTTATLTYATEIELNEYLNLAEYAPAIDNATQSSGTAVETIGQGDNATVNFFLDQRNVIDNTYTLYAGTSTGSARLLTKTTDYTLNLDRGLIALTASGKSNIGTGTLFAEYRYNIAGVSNTIINNALVRAEQTINEEIGITFIDGTGSSPGFPEIIGELHDGKGEYNKTYYTNNYPVIVTRTLTAGTLNNTGTSEVEVDSTFGFPLTGTLTIEEERIAYTAKTGTAFKTLTRAVEGTTAGTHSNEVIVTRHKFEVSTTAEGSLPTYRVLKADDDYHLDGDTGRIYIMNSFTDRDTITGNDLPLKGVPDRVKLTYPYAYKSMGATLPTIPDDIKQATLMIASQHITHGVVQRSTMQGRDEFRPQLVDVDNNWIEQVIDRYRMYRIRNT